VAKIDLPGCSGVTPGPGWYLRKSRYGCVITDKPKGSRFKNSIGSWSIPSPYLGGMKLANWRRSIPHFLSPQWKNSINIDQANFASAMTYTLNDGTTRTQSGHRLFSHFANITWEAENLARIGQGSAPFSYFGFDLSASNPEPAPPIITDAHWDGRDTFSISVTSSDPTGVQLVALYATTPGYTTANGRALFMIGSGTLFATGNYTITHSLLAPSKFLKPWPTGSECLLGLRYWNGDGPIFQLPSPIAAELIVIGD
jgi:hypothetical protein